ncbi:putative membrane protein [Wickerhamomyces ciferrii]|uniref:Membrane protein n=1 Tax=Wickerhamomyces ciferrii (strain ATCC 14091 / BCRC 22168 / CBS 111 / JCM 3599 / NBRC 0793 / NRRL Y-1031 F-60-10) TaxID=1206466 RepID=K0KMD1_WICCF|nr:uncharacterized protein BN7_6019 [Wickerhamomyces ciferrii]CCH46425.1 putative membrane protein [Wickerhamomyces ciferrii]
MDKRPTGRLISNLIHILSISLSFAAGVIAIIFFKNSNYQLNKPSLITLIIGEFISILSLPLLFFNSRLSIIWSLLSINLISSFISLGARLSLFNFSIKANVFQNDLKSQNLLISLFTLIIASQFFHGFTLSSYFNSLFQFYQQNNDPESQRQFDIENLKEKVISLKASAATLVDNRKVSGNQESTTSTKATTTTKDSQQTNGNTDQQSSIFQSTKSRFSSKKDFNSLTNHELKSIIPKNYNNVQNIAQLYSIKKLSIINQSSSSADITATPAKNHRNSNRLSSTTTTSSSQKIDDSIKNAQNAKNLSLERDALKRIPSALLPPHLKPQTSNLTKNQHILSKYQNRSISQPGNLNNLWEFQRKDEFNSNNQDDDNLQNLDQNENVPELIPRAITIENFYPLRTQHNISMEDDNGIRTIAPIDYDQGKFNNFNVNQLKNGFEPEHLLKSGNFDSLDPPINHDQYNDRFTINDDDNDNYSIPDDVQSSHVSTSSTEEALKIVENVQQASSNEFDLNDVIDQSRSSLNLERLNTPNNNNNHLTKSKSYSPHKSIFRGHGHGHGHGNHGYQQIEGNNIGHYRKNSSVSFKNFSVSMPSSPKKKSIMNNSPSKKAKFKKNLSLSNIVFKIDSSLNNSNDSDSEIPNLSYVHDLQSSPSKKRRSSITPSFATTNDIDTHSKQQHQPHNSTTTPSKHKHNNSQLAVTSSNNSPNSNWSENSHISIFPADVIGEYDKEKWKTMQRLQLVKDQETIAQ